MVKTIFIAGCAFTAPPLHTELSPHRPRTTYIGCAFSRCLTGGPLRPHVSPANGCTRSTQSKPPLAHIYPPYVSPMFLLSPSLFVSPLPLGLSVEMSSPVILSLSLSSLTTVYRGPWRQILGHGAYGPWSSPPHDSLSLSKFSARLVPPSLAQSWGAQHHGSSLM